MQIDRVIQLLILGMDLQNLLTALHVGMTHMDLTVKTTGTQQSGIENIGAVGCGKDDDTFGLAEAVHLYQQLVQGLLLFIMAAA